MKGGDLDDERSQTGYLPQGDGRLSRTAHYDQKHPRHWFLALRRWLHYARAIKLG
ncbi:hypothetical protein ACNKHU_12840 [Shigella flexneri]